MSIKPGVDNATVFVRTLELGKQLEDLHALLMEPVYEAKRKVLEALPEEKFKELQRTDKAMVAFFNLGKDEMLRRKKEHAGELDTLKEFRSKFYAVVRSDVLSRNDDSQLFLQVGQAVMRVSMRLADVKECYVADALPEGISNVSKMFSVAPYSNVVGLMEDALAGKKPDDKMLAGVVREVVNEFYSDSAIKNDPFGLSNVDNLGTLIDNLRS